MPSRILFSVKSITYGAKKGPEKGGELWTLTIKILTFPRHKNTPGAERTAPGDEGNLFFI